MLKFLKEYKNKDFSGDKNQIKQIINEYSLEPIN